MHRSAISIFFFFLQLLERQIAWSPGRKSSNGSSNRNAYLCLDGAQPGGQVERATRSARVAAIRPVKKSKCHALVSRYRLAEETKGAEALKGALIACFEAAPQIALAVILEFAAEESTRLFDPAQ